MILEPGCARGAGEMILELGMCQRGWRADPGAGDAALWALGGIPRCDKSTERGTEALPGFSSSERQIISAEGLGGVQQGNPMGEGDSSVESRAAATWGSPRAADSWEKSCGNVRGVRLGVPPPSRRMVLVGGMGGFG